MPTFIFNEARIMPKQSIASLASTAQVPPLTKVRARDATLGDAEFIYLPTIASVTAGSLVTWYQKAAGSVITAVTPNTVQNAIPIAVAPVAGVASTFGWFQIFGTALVKKSASIVTINTIPVISATTGRIRKTGSAGRSILGMRTAASTSAGNSTVLCTFNNPHQSS